LISKLQKGSPIFLASLNMRAGLVLISPLIPILKEHFGLSTAAISLLAGIPIFCFATTSLLMGQVAKLGASNRIIKWALTVLSIALFARTFTGLIGLYLFSFVMGISIAVMNYEMPAWVKEHAPDDTGFMTGVYTTLMGVTAAIAMAVSVPLAELNSLGWEMAMIPWIALATVTALFWWHKKETASVIERAKPVHFWRSCAFKNPVAWALVIFFGLESLVFYATSTWLPTILLVKGFSLSGGALAVSLSGLTGSLIGLTVPHYVGKYRDKRIFLVTASLLTAIAFFVVSLQSGPIVFLWLCLANIGLSICFPLSLMLTGTKTLTPEETRNLSTMMQSIGYVLSAMGPGLLGLLFESFGSWNTALLGIVALSLVQMVMGWIVGKPSLISS
jgi:CP family cyanate transporter-like MFS transporter